MSFLNFGTAIMNVEAILSKQCELIDPDAPDAETIMAICHNFRIISCGNYLADLDAEKFCETLGKSGNLYLDMLTDEENRAALDPYYCCTSRAAPLIDSLACGNFTTAGAIAESLPVEINRDQGETEEDFYTFFLLTKLLQTDSPTQLQPVVDDLPEIDEPQFLILKAIIAQEPEDFYLSLFELIQDWKYDIDEKKEMESVPYYDSLTTAYICIEGIAYLKLAMKFGIPPTDSEIFYIPGPIVECEEA